MGRLNSLDSSTFYYILLSLMKHFLFITIRVYLLHYYYHYFVFGHYGDMLTVISTLLNAQVFYCNKYIKCSSVTF